MSFTSKLIKTAVKCTPKKMVTWVANWQLKGIVDVLDYDFDIDARKIYSKTLLEGEAEPIEVWLEDFAIIKNGDSYQFILREARANRLWLSNLLGRVIDKSWPIPVPAAYAGQFELIYDLFKAEDKSEETAKEEDETQDS